MKQQRVNWWERRNNLEKILVVIIAILLCCLLSIFIVILLHFNHAFDKDVVTSHSENIQTAKYEEVKTESFCITPACIKTAAKIMDLVNTSADPCDNFHDFVCSITRKKWEETNKFADLKMVQTVIENRIKNLIVEPISEQLPKPLQLQRTFYESCMNTTEINENRHDALLNLIGKVGGWPVRQGRFWNGVNFDWIKFMVKCRNLGIEINSFFLNITTERIVVDGIEKVVLLIKPPFRDFIPLDLQEEYFEVMTNISLELGAFNDKYAKTEYTRVLKFENDLKNVFFDHEANIITVGTLQSIVPSVPWIDFLSNLTSTPIKNDSFIDIRGMGYLLHVSDLLNRTSKSVQANYVIWKIVENYRNYLSEPLQDTFNAFLMKINPSKVLIDRKSFCLDKAKFYFPAVAEAAYVRNYLENHTRAQINEVIGNITKQVQTELEENNQLDDESRKLSVIKLKQVTERIKSYEQVYLEKFDKLVGMENFDFNSDNIIDMDSQLYARKMVTHFKDINRNVNEIDKEKFEKSSILDMYPVDERSYKTLVFHTFFLDEIMHHFESPFYVNYATLGSVIADEFNHFVLEENQDVDLAYKAYKGWVRQHFPEKDLPGLFYSQDQIFWITFGITKCYQLQQDDYRPPSASIITNTRNSRHFATAFRCPKD